MSNTYKLEFTAITEDDRVLWMLTSRLGMIWTGSLAVSNFDDHKREATFDIHIDQPSNTPIPARAMSLIKHRVRQLLYRAIDDAVKQLFDKQRQPPKAAASA